MKVITLNKYKAPRIATGDLRTPVVFFEYEPNEGFEPGQKKKKILHECMALVYSPSMKDIEILKVNDTKEGVTLKVRDTKGEYTPTNTHFVEVLDYRYKGKVWNVIDVSYDFEDSNFNKIVLGDAYGGQN